MGKIISIANQKGGVGKTTTAINLSASLAIAEKRCLLIDCDPQGNATTGLGIDKMRASPGLYELLIENIIPQEAIMNTLLPGLSIICANRDLVGVEVLLISEEGREFRLKERIGRLKEEYDYILIDCPPSLGFITLNALVASDSVIIPCQCEFYALEGLEEIFSTIKAVKNSLNPSIQIEGILLTMHDSRNNLSLQVEQEARRHFKDLVFKTVIPRNVRLSEAPSYGKPILLYDIKCKGSQSYLSLAREMLNKG